MPKRRNTDDRIENYYRKIRKIQSEKRRRIRVILSDSSDSEGKILTITYLENSSTYFIGIDCESITIS